MTDNNEENKFSSQYLSVLQDYVEQIAKDPKNLEDMLGNFMKIQESFFGNETLSSKLLDNPLPEDSSNSSLVSMLKTMSEDVQQIKKRIIRMERFIMRLKTKSSSNNDEEQS